MSTDTHIPPKSFAEEALRLGGKGGVRWRLTQRAPAFCGRS